MPEHSEREQEALGPLLKKGYRLACETLLTGGAIVRIPEESRVRRQVILTSATHHPYPVRIRPCVDHYYVEVPPPTLDTPRADHERLLLALNDTYGIKQPRIDPFMLKELPHALRSDKKGLTAVIRDKREIIAIYPGKEESLFGMAFYLIASSWCPFTQFLFLDTSDGVILYRIRKVLSCPNTMIASYFCWPRRIKRRTATSRNGFCPMV